VVLVADARPRREHAEVPLTDLDPLLWSAVRVVVEKIFPATPDESCEAWLTRLKHAHALLREAVAMALDEFVDPAREERAKKQAWIENARASFRSGLGKRQPCGVCGKFSVVSQAHHLTPLAWQYERGLAVADHAHVWLCPSHHASIHAVLEGHVEASSLIERDGIGQLPVVFGIIKRAGMRP
jgi:hypothetical protein